MKKYLSICLFVLLVFFTGCKNSRDYQILSVATTEYSDVFFSEYDLNLKILDPEIKTDKELNKKVTLFGNSIVLEYDHSYLTSILVSRDAYKVVKINDVDYKNSDGYICFSDDGKIANIIGSNMLSGLVVDLSTTKENRASNLLEQAREVFDIDLSYNDSEESISGEKMIIQIGNNDTALTNRCLTVICDKSNGKVKQISYTPPISKKITDTRIPSNKQASSIIEKKVNEMKNEQTALKNLKIKDMRVVEYNDKIYCFYDVDVEITQSEKQHTSTDYLVFLISIS